MAPRKPAPPVRKPAAGAQRSATGDAAIHSHSPSFRPQRPIPPPPLWLYERHTVLAAVANPARILDRLLATEQTVAELAAAVARSPVPRPAPEVSDRRAIEALLPAESVHQGMAARARLLPPVALDDILEEAARRPSALLVVLDQVTDPRNVGAILRSAAAFEATAIVVQDRHAPAESGALAKAASGAAETVPLVRTVNLTRALEAMKEARFHCIGLAAEAPSRLSDARLASHVVMVFGSEGRGLRRRIGETCDETVSIPIARGVDSLNISVAVAIGLYEVRRGRVPAADGATAPTAD